MKKLLSIIVIISSSLLLFSCVKVAKPNNDTTPNSETVYIATDTLLPDVTAPEPENTTETTSEETTAPPYAVNNSTEAVEACKQKYGSVDELTGYKYAYSYDETIEDNGTTYYKVRLSWYIEEEERYSTCGYLLVDKYGNISEYNW